MDFVNILQVFICKRCSTNNWHIDCEHRKLIDAIVLSICLEELVFFKGFEKILEIIREIYRMKEEKYLQANDIIETFGIETTTIRYADSLDLSHKSNNP